jgi:hypothetical protein
MSDAPLDQQDAVPPPFHESAPAPGARRLGPLPVWLWIVLAAIAVALLIILAIVLFAGGSKPSGLVSPKPSLTTASPTPYETPSPTPTPTADDPAGPGTFDSDLPNFVADALNSQNTAVLSQSGTFSNPIFVIAANSDLSENMSPDDAVGTMEFMFTPGDPHPWDLALSDGVLAGYRAGPFGRYFPVGAIVARSNDGHVFSFLGHDSTITTMFLAASEDLLH